MKLFESRLLAAIVGIFCCSAGISLYGVPPTITAQPVSARVSCREHVSFEVSAEGGNLTYQWRRSGQPIDGATARIFELPDAALVDSGFYDVVVAGGAESTISNAVQLEVLPQTSAGVYRMDDSFAPLLASQVPNTSVRLLTAVALTAERELVVGGTFSVFMGQRRSNLARVLPSMALDATFRPVIDGPVNAVVALADGKVLVGGAFNSVNGSRCLGLAMLNADGSLVEDFNPFATYATASVSSIVVQPDGRFVVAGEFLPQTGGSSRDLAAVSSSGALVDGFAPSRIAPTGYNILALATVPDGRIYVAYTWHVVRLLADGSSDSSFATVDLATTEGEFRRLAVQGDGKLVVGGCLTAGVVRFETNGTPDPTFKYGGGSNVSSLLQLSDGRLLVGCTVGLGPNPPRLACLDATGAVSGSFTLSRVLNGSVDCLTVHPEAGFLAAGSFSQAGGAPVAGIVHLGDDGAFLSSVPGYFGYEVGPTQVAALPAGQLLVAGNFSYVGSVPRAGLAVLNADGSLDPAFNPDKGLAVAGPRSVGDSPAVPDGIAVDGAGRCLLWGNFDRYAGQPCARLIRVNPTGVRDSSFSAASDVRYASVVVGPQGQLYAAASPISAGPAQLIRLLDSGLVDTSFTTSEVPPAYGIGADGGLLMVRRVTEYATDHYYPVRVLPTGLPDGAFGSGLGFTGNLCAGTVGYDGRVCFGGEFSYSYGDSFGCQLLELAADGAFQFRTGLGAGEITRVDQIVATSDGWLLRGPPSSSRVAALSYPCLTIVDAQHAVHRVDLCDVVAPRLGSASTGLIPRHDGRLLLIGVDGRRNGVTTKGWVLLRREMSSPLPVLQGGPTIVYAREGERLTLPVSASGEGVLAFQWYKNGTGITGATAPQLVLDPVGLADAADYSVEVSNSFGTATGRIANVVVHNELQTSYGDWAAAHFSATELADPAISGPLADPDGAGLTNLARYAFKTAARGPVTAPYVTMQIAVLWENASAMKLQFQRKTYAPGLKYVVEATSDLAGKWTVVSEFEPGYPEYMTVQDYITLESCARRFLRVRIVQEP